MNEKTVADKMFLRTAKSMLILNGQVNPGVVSQMPAELVKEGDGPFDVILMFCMNRKDLEHFLPQAKEKLGDKGSLWIAYLKQTASKATDINRDSINDYAKENGITSVAMISIDGDWSALRAKRIEV
ncbi:class I SAM-dependent methyltransferase [Massilia sp. ZL223]|uniref:class I SAM-dependent methyltransferase n=1 Tax=Massilia sp. ZL223 TaxID=2824904 RepID=UPI001B816147|nr:class I SAM-dependent methyltransferase [Massilia sp. ZL223]MBQ5963541.1 class I SAM-dependent methyltransferase [Massilia sp. ZL223]